MALLLFDEMFVESILPDVISFNAAISSCEKGCQWEMSLDLFQAMMSQMVLATIVTYNATISSCEKGVAVGIGLGTVQPDSGKPASLQQS